MSNEGILFDYLDRNRNIENSLKDNSTCQSKIFTSMTDDGGKLSEPDWGQAHGQISWKAGKP